MPTLYLNDDLFTYAASDVLRLFFGKVKIKAEGKVLETARLPGFWTCSWTAEGCAITVGPAPPDLPGMTESLRTSLRNDGEKLRLARRELKRQLYFFCVTKTGMEFPWGSLTGIRPTQVAAEVLADLNRVPEGERTRRAVEELRETYGVHPEKGRLALATLKEEEALLSRFPKEMCAVYIGVPFCPTRCHYCSFSLHEGIGVDDSLKEKYVDHLIREIEQVGEWFDTPVRSIYIGGGTPTELDAGQLDRLMATVEHHLPLTADCERSLEAGRPDTIDRQKLETALKWGFDRICVNPQTMHDRTLRLIGRGHTVEQTVAAFNLARKLNFRDINMDLIAGLPAETLLEFEQSLERVIALKPDSVTVHSLAVKRSSNLNFALSESGGTLAELKHPDEQVENMMSLAERALQRVGLVPYYLYRQKDGAGGLENVGFATPGNGNLYNIAMMGDRRDVLGFGCGSMSKRRFAGNRVERSPEVKSVLAWLGRVDEMVERKKQLFQAT